MYLDAVKEIRETDLSGNGNGYHQPAREVFDKWKDWHPSEISHHGEMCCEIAREWITATDLSELGGVSRFTGPRWLRQKFKWGASSFPIYWCEVVRKKTLDCGALAALAAEVFRARGVKTYRVQMIQRFSEISTFQWSNSWSDGTPLRWTEDDLIYHEGCAITLPADDLKIWDSSAGWWVEPKACDGYGAMLAARISGPGLDPESGLKWGLSHLPVLRWVRLS